MVRITHESPYRVSVITTATSNGAGGNERSLHDQLFLVRIRHAWFDPALLEKPVPACIRRARELLLSQPYDHASQLLVRRRFQRYVRFHFDPEQLSPSFRSALLCAPVGTVDASRTWIDHVAFSTRPTHSLPIITARGLLRLPLHQSLDALADLQALEGTLRDRLSWAVTLHLDLPNGDAVSHDSWEELDVVPIASRSHIAKHGRPTNGSRSSP